MSTDEAPSKLIDVWYAVDDQNLSLRTSILKPKALIAIHKMQMLYYKLLLFVSLPKSVNLTEEWNKYEQLILSMKEKARVEQDDALMREANILSAKLELAKRYNTLPDFLDRLSILNLMLARMINAASAIEGRTFYGVLGYQQQRRRRFGLLLNLIRILLNLIRIASYIGYVCL
jgi:hypothetical protein